MNGVVGKYFIAFFTHFKFLYMKDNIKETLRHKSLKEIATGIKSKVTR
jgi:hypothetical protein